MNSLSAVTATVLAWFLLVLGFSYLLQAPRWIRLLREAMQQPEKNFPFFIFLLLTGLFIVQVHNVWVKDWPLIVTIFGWLLVLKAALMLVFPQISKMFSSWSDALMISVTRISGVIMVVLATMLIYHSPVIDRSEIAVSASDAINDRAVEVLTGMDIDYVELEVRDMEKAKTFYAALFSWTYTDYGPEYTAFHGKKTEGGFALSNVPRVGGPLVVFRTNDLEMAYGQVNEMGATINREIFEFPGGRRFEFEDPSGNRLAIWSDK